MAGDDEVISLFLKRGEKIPGLGVGLICGAVLLEMYPVDGTKKIRFRTVSLPYIECGPLIRSGKTVVYLPQFLIKGIAKLPEGIVNVDNRYLAFNRFLLSFI